MVELLTIPEAADRLRISRRTLDSWIAKGVQAGPIFKKMAGKWCCSEEMLDEWIKSEMNSNGGL